MSYDILKAALAKKQASQQQPKKKDKTNSGKSVGVHSQVTSNKPAKKSAGRGR
jgi:hypothetical protein